MANHPFNKCPQCGELDTRRAECKSCGYKLTVASAKKSSRKKKAEPAASVVPFFLKCPECGELDARRQSCDQCGYGLEGDPPPKPTPKPAARPTPKPDPVPEPQVVDKAPEPASKPEPEKIPEPTPRVQPEKTPEPDPEPVLEEKAAKPRQQPPPFRKKANAKRGRPKNVFAGLAGISVALGVAAILLFVAYTIGSMDSVVIQLEKMKTERAVTTGQVSTVAERVVMYEYAAQGKRWTGRYTMGSADAEPQQYDPITITYLASTPAFHRIGPFTEPQIQSEIETREIANHRNGMTCVAWLAGAFLLMGIVGAHRQIGGFFSLLSGAKAEKKIRRELVDQAS